MLAQARAQKRKFVTRSRGINVAALGLGLAPVAFAFRVGPSARAHGLHAAARH